MIPGEIRVSETPLELNAGLARRSLVIVNDGDRPIQIGSHLHLADANPALSFDRGQARGFRLDVPAGTSVRFEPGVSRRVDLVALAGRARVPGLQLRDGSDESPTYNRQPRQVVPFGTPGTEVETPSRAAAVRARVSTEPVPDDDSAEDDDAGRHDTDGPEETP